MSPFFITINSLYQNSYTQARNMSKYNSAEKASFSS